MCARRNRPAPPRHDDLYLIASKAMSRIKIGRSDNVEVRFKQIRGMSPDPDLEIIGIAFGCGDHESLSHRAFAEHWSHGEWFYDCQVIREWVARGCVIDELYPLVVSLEIDGFDFEGFESSKLT